MSVSTVALDLVRRADGVYITVHTESGPAVVGPLDLSRDACLTAIVAQPIAPPKKTGPTPKQRRKASMQQEDEIAAQHEGGRRVRGSGSGKTKGDARVLGKFRFEAKYTSSGTYPLKLSELAKIRSEATNQEIPGFVVEFKDETLRTLDSWTCIPSTHMEHLKYEPPYATTLNR